MDPTTIIIVIVLVILLLIAAKMSIRIVRQYEQGVLFRLGRVIGVPAAILGGVLLVAR